jgi:hypothetical protein
MILMSTVQVQKHHSIGIGESRLWNDARSIALQFGSTVDPALQDTLWNHLLLAAGNFKRQAKLFPPSLSIQRAQSATLPRVVSIRAGSGANIQLDAYNSSTWQMLERMTRGLGVATTTAILGLLWPQDHAIIDIRALNASVALAGHRGLWTLTNAAKSGVVETTWDAYDWYRPHVVATAQATGYGPLDIERALYNIYPLGLEKRGGKVVPGSWQAYAGRLVSQLLT